MGKPRRGKAREYKFNQVQKGGLDVAEGEVEGPQVLAYFGTDVDRGEGAIGVDVDGVEDVGTKRCDKERGLSLLKIDLPGDMVEEVGVDELFVGVPDVAALFVDDGVLVRVVVVRSKARRGGKEMGEGEEVGGKRGEEGGGRRRGGRGDGGDRGFDNGRGDVFDRDVFGINDFTWELKLRPSVLIERGKEAVEFGLGKADDVGSGLFTKLFEIELGRGAKGFEGGLRGRRGWGSNDVGVGVDGAGLESVGVNEEDVGVGGRGGIDGGGGGNKKRKTGDDELGTGGNGGRPGYGGGLGAAGILEAGASRTGVVPRVVGAVEGVVDDLEGGAGVGLIDFVQVGPGGDGEGRGRH